MLESRLSDLFDKPSFVAVTSLAAGADQRFAEMALSRGGKLYVVVPSSGYESSMASREDRSRFRQMLSAASTVERLDYPRPSEEAFFAAGRRVVDICDVLVALWDGLPARGVGGTADVVSYAQSVGKSVDVVWPEGLRR